MVTRSHSVSVLCFYLSMMKWNHGDSPSSIFTIKFNKIPNYYNSIKYEARRKSCKNTSYRTRQPTYSASTPTKKKKMRRIWRAKSMPRRTKCGGLSRACGPSAVVAASAGGGGSLSKRRRLCFEWVLGGRMTLRGQGIGLVRAFASFTHFLSFFYFSIHITDGHL
jgi:hypothetical protein